MSRGAKQKYDETLLELQKQYSNTEEFPYINNKGKKYPVYFRKEYLDYLINKMSHNDKKAYEKGAGRELNESPKTGEPPKMLSVASSSRFCFLGLKESNLKVFNIDKQDGNNIEFEKKLPILQKGTPPHMDAYYHLADCEIYFECKCHEMFDKHSINLSMNYFKDNLLCAKIDKSYYYAKDNECIVHPSYFLPKDSNFSKANSLTFDVKQLLTHLMGIKTHMEKEGRDRARLIYFYFIPEVKYHQSIQCIIDRLYGEVKEIFHCDFIQNFIKENNITIELYVQKSMVVQTATKENTVFVLDSSIL